MRGVVVELAAQVLHEYAEPPTVGRVLRADDLVTVVGRIQQFTYQHFAGPYQLRQASAYGAFEGRKVLVADTFRSDG